jgi:hypothetical protein
MLDAVADVSTKRLYALLVTDDPQVTFLASFVISGLGVLTYQEKMQIPGFPSRLALDPIARFIYASDDSGTQIICCGVDSGKFSSPLVLDNVVSSGVGEKIVSNDGRYLVVADKDNLICFAIDQTTGRLTKQSEVKGSVTGLVRAGVNGKYICAIQSPGIVCYEIGTEGTLLLRSTASVAIPLNSDCIATLDVP